MTWLRTHSYLFISSVIMFIFSACQKEGKITEEKIIGSWTVSEVNLDASVNDMTLYEFFSFQNSASLQEMQAALDTLQQSYAGKLTFDPDKTYLLTADSLPSDSLPTGIWSISTDGLKLTLTPNEGQEELYDLLSVSGTALHTSLYLSDSADYNHDGIQDNFSVTVDLNYIK